MSYFWSKAKPPFWIQDGMKWSERGERRRWGGRGAQNVNKQVTGKSGVYTVCTCNFISERGEVEVIFPSIFQDVTP